MWLRIHTFLIVLFLIPVLLRAQESRKDIEKKADRFFNKESYVDATPLYVHLLSLEPKNPNYNYRYGTCLLYNSKSKKDAFKYLNFATKQGNDVEDEAYYFLGKAYLLTFQFDKAIASFNEYKRRAKDKVLANLGVDHQIEMCYNGKNLLSKIYDIIVLKKTQIDIESFFRIYELKDIGGQLIVSAEFQSKQDKKMNHIPLIHFQANPQRIFYSSYGDKNDNKDIYFRNKFPRGGWSDPIPVKGFVNTNYDEDFPFMDSKGEYLYFSSKGHNSMGGYDIFRSKYNLSTDSFDTPENLDFPISSPSNDFLYIVDSLNQYAYFASQRESEMNKTHVYSIRVEQIPIEMVVIKGTFASEINAKEKRLAIHIFDNKGVPAGEVTTSQNGEYLITLPRSGNYQFVMQVGKKESQHKENLTIPSVKHPLKQRITEISENEKEKIVIDNRFDENFDDEQSILAEALELRSKMEVNSNQFDLDAISSQGQNADALSKLGLTNFSNNEIIGLVEKKEKELSERNSNIQLLQEKATTQLATSVKQFNENIDRIDNLLSSLESSANKSEKMKLLEEANEILNQSNSISHEIEVAQDIIRFTKEKGENTSKLIDEMNSLSSYLQEHKNQDEEILKGLLNHSNFVKNELRKETLSDIAFEYQSTLNEGSVDVNELNEERRQLLSQKARLTDEKKAFERQFETASNKQKTDLEIEISRAEGKIDDLQREITFVENKLSQARKIEIQKEALKKINTTTPNLDEFSISELNVDNNLIQNKLKSSQNYFEKTLHTSGIEVTEDGDLTATNEPLNNSNNSEQDDEISNYEYTHENKMEDSSPVDKENNTFDNFDSNSAITDNETIEPHDDDDIDNDNDNNIDNDNYANQVINDESIETENIETESFETPQNTLFQIDHAYQGDIAWLKGEQNAVELADKIEYQQQIIRRQKNLLNKINTEQLQAKQQNDASSRRRVENLTHLHQQIEQELEESEEVLAQLNSELNRQEDIYSDENVSADFTTGAITKKTESETPVIDSPEEILNSIDASYQTEIALLDKRLQTNDLEEKMEIQRQIVKRQNELLNKIETELSKTKHSIATGQNNKSNRLKEKNITQLQQQIEQEVETSEEILNQFSSEKEKRKDFQMEETIGEETGTNEFTNNNATISPLENTLNSVDASYQTDIASLQEKLQENNLEGKIKMQQLIIKRQSELLNRVKARISQTEHTVAAGDNSETTRIKAENLMQLQQKVQHEVEHSKEHLTQLKLGLDEGNNSQNTVFETGNYNEIQEDRRITSSQQSPSPTRVETGETTTSHNEEAISTQSINSVFNFEDVMSSVDASYLVEIKTLEDKNETTPSVEVKKEILIRKRQAYFVIEELITEKIIDNPNSTSQSEVAQLHRAKSTLATEIKQLENEIEALGEDLSQIQGDFQQQTILATAPSSKEKEELNDLYQKKEELKRSSKGTAKQEKKLEKKIAEKEQKVISNTIERNAASVRVDVNEISSSNPNSIDALSSEAKMAEIDRLLYQAENTKESLKARDFAFQAHQLQQEMIEELEEKKHQAKIANFLHEATENNQLEHISSNKNALKTEENIISEQDQILVQSAHIKNQIRDVEAQLSSANKKEKPALNEQIQELSEIERKLESVAAENRRTIEKQITEHQNTIQGVPNKASIENNLTYEKEVEIAQTEEYRVLAKENHKLQDLQYSYKMKTIQLETEKSEISQLIASSEKPEMSDNRKTVINELLVKINTTLKEIETVKTQIKQQQEVIEMLLVGTDLMELPVIENLLIRDVKYMPKTPVTPIVTVASGIVIAKNNYSDENPIPLNIERPSGLIFRVQVGAFYRPVPNSTFKQFAPISGESVNDRLIRYVVGAFNDRKSAEQARDKIRALGGYDDAFVVAYCDGERVPVYRAVQLMNSGECVPQLSAPENPIAETDKTPSNIYHTTTPTKTFDEYAYNKINGENTAEVGEKKLGLYFTVQVGVYNTPVPSNQLFNITPLVTLRLPNGQLRYSSGIFNSVNEAITHRNTAQKLGISDAYVTAYNNGIRISIEEANKLLSEKGNSILENITPTTNEVLKNHEPIVQKEIKSAFLDNKPTSTQWVSLEQYNDYPLQVLNRYNAEGGLFYFDHNDRFIKSILFNETAPLHPSISLEFKAVELYQNSYLVKDKEATTINDAIEHSEKACIMINTLLPLNKITPDIMDILLTASFNKTFKIENENLLIDFFALESNANTILMEQLNTKLLQLGVDKSEIKVIRSPEE